MEKYPAFMKNSVHKPSDATKHDPEVLPYSLLPEYIYGCSKKNVKGSFMFVNAMGHLVYPSAACGVTLNVEQNTQKLFRKHDDDVTCFALHPDGITVATGQMGKHDCVYVYNSETMDLLASLKTESVFTEGGVLAIAFNPDGTKLAVLGGRQEESTLLIFNWQTQEKLAKGKGTTGLVYGMVFADDDTIFICGKKMLKHIVWHGSMLDNSAPAVGGISTYCSVRDATTNRAFIGNQEGNVLVLKEKQVVSKHKAHEGPVYCIAKTKDNGFITGGKDGKVHMWDAKFQLQTTFQVASAVKAVAQCTVNDKHIYACLSNGDFVQIDTATSAVVAVMKGHCGDGEMWALACVPNSDLFVSGADDGRVIVWNKATRKHVCEAKLKTEKVRGVAVSPNGQLVACGCFDGTVQIFDLNANSLTLVKQFQSGKEELAVVRFSPSGKTLAVGSHDNMIRLYSVEKNFAVKATLTGHTSFVTALDYSVDGNFIQSTCGAYELLFWNAKDGTRVMDGAALKDTAWQTHSCKLGWRVRGIWVPHHYNDGSDINAVAANSTLALTVVGDDLGKVVLFPYPTSTVYPPNETTIGHCSHVTNVQFSPDNQYVLSAGGADLAIMQHKIVKK